MTRVVIDSQTLKALGGLAGPVEFCGPQGETLGFYQPATASNLQEFDWGISAEELQRREQEGGDRTLTEILADLENRK